MKEREFYIPQGGPPQGMNPNSKIFEKMGQENIYQMIEDFYQELKKSSIHHLFPTDMIEASRRSAAFFVFILGGPPLYQQQFGSPMMRKRHLDFKIDEEARTVWLNCFKTTLQEAEKKYQFPVEHLNEFWSFLERFSAWMVNTQS
jgi:hemoglobin